jgi:hypothetical protein
MIRHAPNVPELFDGYISRQDAAAGRGKPRPDKCGGDSGRKMTCK